METHVSWRMTLQNLKQVCYFYKQFPSIVLTSRGCARKLHSYLDNSAAKKKQGKDCVCKLYAKNANFFVETLDYAHIHQMGPCSLRGKLSSTPELTFFNKEFDPLSSFNNTKCNHGYEYHIDPMLWCKRNNTKYSRH